MRRAFPLGLTVIAMGIAALVLFWGHSDGHSAQSHHLEIPQFTTRTGLLVTSRDRFRVCAEISKSLDKESGRVIAGINRALRGVRQHPDWEPAGYGAGQPHVERGCPGAALPESLLDDGAVVGPGIVKEPGIYRTAILVLDGPQAEAVLGAGNTAVAGFESMCDPPDGAGNRSCATVTTALVVRASILDDPTAVLVPLTLAAGLDAARKDVTGGAAD